MYLLQIYGAKRNIWVQNGAIWVQISDLLEF